VWPGAVRLTRRLDTLVWVGNCTVFEDVLRGIDQHLYHGFDLFEVGDKRVERAFLLLGEEGGVVGEAANEGGLGLLPVGIRHGLCPITTMLCCIAGASIEMRGPSGHVPYSGPMKIVGRSTPRGGWAHSCPLMFDEDVAGSCLDMHAHLTFADGRVTHVAPALVARCAEMYALVVGGGLGAEAYFVGRVPTAQPGTAATMLKRRLRRTVKLPHRAHVCTHFAHTGDRVVSAADVLLPMQLFQKALCPRCMNQSYFRHVAPTAAAVGAGYMQLDALRARCESGMWTNALAFLSTVTENDLVAGVFELSSADAAAVIQRPRAAIICGKVDSGGLSAGMLRLLAILGRAATKSVVTACPPEIRDALWDAGVVRSDWQLKGGVKEVYIRGGGLVFEREAQHALNALVLGRVLVLQLTAEPSCATWAEVGRSARLSGSLSARNTPFALLVEAAVKLRLPGLTLDRSTALLMPAVPAAGDLATMEREAQFLSDLEWDWGPGPGAVEVMDAILRCERLLRQ
jgi:hypothetical protein